MKLHKILTLITLSIYSFLQAQSVLPDDFFEIEVSDGWDNAVGFTFDPIGQMYVWEKPGKVHVIDTNGIRINTPLLDIQEEVAAYQDVGLLGFALDPNFTENGYFYIAYAVDGHHLRYAGTPQYNLDSLGEISATIGRVTRYTADAATNFQSLIPDSRKILIGEIENYKTLHKRLFS